MSYFKTIEIKGLVSENNSTSTPLGISASFIGTSEEVTNYAIIYVSVLADADSDVDGLKIQQSADGTNWDWEDTFSITADVAKTFSFQAAMKYFRVVFVNGTSAQSSFELQTVFKGTYGKPSSHKIQDAIVDEDDAELVKSIITGKTPSSIFKNVNVSEDGNLTISDNSDGLAISEGNVTGKGFVHKFGQAPDFDTGDGEVTIWDGADDGGINEMTYNWSTTAAIDSISSSNAGDTQEVKIQGLDSSFNLVEQTVTLNGQTRVALTTSLIRVFRGKNNDLTAFSGYVYVYENTALSGGVPIDTTKIRLVIQNGNNQTLMALYTVPNGKTAYVRDWYASTAGASKSSQYIIRLWAREYSDADAQHKVWQLKHVTSISDVGTSYIQHKYEEPEKFFAKADIMMTAEATATGVSECSISGGFDLVLVND